MAIPLVTFDGIFAGTAADLFSHAFDTAAGNLIIASLDWSNDAGLITVSSVTDAAGNIYHPLTLHRLAGNESAQQVWYAYNTLAKAGNIVHAVFSDTISGGFPSLRTDQFGLSSTVDPFDVEEITGTGTSTTLLSGAFSTTGTGEELIYSCGITIGGPNYTAGGGATLINPGGYGDQYQVVTGVQSGITATMTVDSSGLWNFNVATFKAPAPTPPGGGTVGPGWPWRATYGQASDITPSDTVNFDASASWPYPRACDALYVGGAGTIIAVLEDGSTQAVVGVAGTIVPVRAIRVNDTDTTATDLVALWA
jgi:hypothetical protein